MQFLESYQSARDRLLARAAQYDAASLRSRDRKGAVCHRNSLEISLRGAKKRRIRSTGERR